MIDKRVKLFEISGYEPTEKRYINEGILIGFVSAPQHSSAVAIVKLDDGTVLTWPAPTIQFVEEDSDKKSEDYETVHVMEETAHANGDISTKYRPVTLPKSKLETVTVLEALKRAKATLKLVKLEQSFTPDYRYSEDILHNMGAMEQYIGEALALAEENEILKKKDKK